MALRNLLYHGPWLAIVLVALLFSPLEAQTPQGTWPPPNQYPAPAPPQYTPPNRYPAQAPLQYTPPNRYPAPAPPQYTPPPPNRYAAPAPNPHPNPYAPPASSRRLPMSRLRPQAPARQPLRVAERTQPVTATTSSQLQPAQAGEHPLVPALRWAKGGLPDVEKIKDYSATLVKHERVGGKLMDPEYLFVKVRHNPFSIYAYFLGPAKVKGQEVIYVDGQNNGKMWAHTTGIQDAMVGTVSIPPNGMLAMRGQRYPITELGVLNMVRRLIEVAEADSKYGECEVKYYRGAKVNGRVCTLIEVIHPVPRRNFLYYRALIFVDDELNIPIRFASYDWPRKTGEQPELIEEYTYLNLKLDCGFTDADFDLRNPNYRFR